VILNFNTQR